MTQSKADLQQQVQWQHPERKPLLTWDIKARNYNTAIMTGFYIFGLIVICSMSILFYWIGLDKKNNEWFSWMSVTGSSIFFLFMISFFYPWTHPRKIFVYRLTAEGFEVQGWNDIEKWKTVVIGIGIALVIAILGLVSVFPEAIFGLFIGPPLMGLLYYRLFMSEDYWDMQKDLTKRSFEWNDPEIIGLSIDNKRFIVTLFVVKKGRLFNQILSYKFHVFCPKDRFAEIIEFFKQHLPHLECGEARADVYSHEC